MSAEEISTGGCQCGRVRYRILGEPLTLYACHCLDCQKQSSSAFGMSLRVEQRAFELERGTPKLWRTAGDSGAIKVCAFCDECGSRIYHAPDDTVGALSVKAGTLDTAHLLRPIAHIWTRSAQPWVLSDFPDLPRIEGDPDDDVLLALWQAANKD